MTSASWVGCASRMRRAAFDHDDDSRPSCPPPLPLSSLRDCREAAAGGALVISSARARSEPRGARKRTGVKGHQERPRPRERTVARRPGPVPCCWPAAAVCEPTSARRGAGRWGCQCQCRGGGGGVRRARVSARPLGSGETCVRRLADGRTGRRAGERARAGRAGRGERGSGRWSGTDAHSGGERRRGRPRGARRKGPKGGMGEVESSRAGSGRVRSGCGGVAVRRAEEREGRVGS